MPSGEALEELSRWSPHVTVAAVIERDQHFLVVEELSQRKTVINQPAGHLEDGESLLHAVVREVLEETAWDFVPHNLLGVYRWRNAHNGTTHLRVAFCGQVGAHYAERSLDHGILATHWLSYAELQARADQHRSPMVMRCIDDYLGEVRYPLGLVAEVE